jgi:uncharacterized protein
MSVTAPDLPKTERVRAQPARTQCIDCDIHPAIRSPKDMQQYLPQHWRDHMAHYGARQGQPFTTGTVPYTRMMYGNGRRLDAWPPGGGTPGSDLEFMRSQHLDPNGIEFGLLHPLPVGTGVLHMELGAAICAATNQWQLDYWTKPEPRLKASLCVSQEYPESAVKEIRARARESDFVQIAFAPRTLEPLGRPKYWPIYQEAVEYDLPLSLHNVAYGTHPISGAGWPSFYIEDHYAFAHNMQSVISSLIFEGVFDRFPTLKLVVVEGGFAWAAALAWRLDRCWNRLRDEVPHVKHPPSHYMRNNVWYTTQPIEEPETDAHLLDTIRWMGADRLLFSTDYPHWDFDDPRLAFKVALPPDIRTAIMHANARQLFRL